MGATVLAVCIFASAFSYAWCIKCYDCKDGEENCNGGNCEGDWCTAVYVTKNPFANDQQNRVYKSCGSGHPVADVQNDSCVESISPSGRKLSCGCRQDYCNGDKQIQMLPVKDEVGGAGGAAEGPLMSPPPNSTSSSSWGGRRENQTIVHAASTQQTKLKCVCDTYGGQECFKDQCQGAYCWTKVYGDYHSAFQMTAGNKLSPGVRVSKGCAHSLPSDLLSDGNNNNKAKKLTMIMKENVTVIYCDNTDYCNGASGISGFLPPLSVLVGLIVAVAMLV